MDTALRRPPLVGREHELERLEAALTELEAGREACLVLEGEPGIGKTRLLHELRGRGEARGHLVLTGIAAEFERDLPFSVWIDALDAYVASQELDRDPRWDGDVGQQLAGLLPSLRVSAPAAVADERFRGHRALRSLIGLLAEDQALVLVLDDLHWADRASLELLASLVGRGTGASVLLALAFRQGQAPAPLSAALAAPGVTRLTLEPLSEAQAAELVGGAHATALFRHSGGNPFYLEELARAPQPPTTDEGPLQDGVPAAVAAALTAELQALPVPARSLLQGAAVAGEPFEPDLAAAAAELDPGVGLQGLDELLAVGLVRATPVPRRFAFRHPLVRSAVYAATPGGWRLAAHARTAQTLAARGAGPGEQAHHVEQSARPGDEEAIALLVAAGDAAAGRAPATAGRWYGAALRLLPDADRARRVDLLAALAAAQRSAGELERCRATLLSAVELLGDQPARRIELTALCAAVEHWLGRHDEAHQRLVRAWEALPDQATPEGAALQIELAVDALYLVDVEGAEAMARGALDAARLLDDAALHAGAASALALAQALQGATQDAGRHRAEAIDLIDGLTDAELAPRLEALYFLGWAENYLERYADALAHVDRAIAIARATGQGRLLVPLMLTKPYPLEMAGRVAEAREVCDAALEAARLGANPHFQAWALFEKAWVHYYAGEPEETIAACEESFRLGRRLVQSTMPASGGGPGWPMASARYILGQPQALLDLVAGFGDDTLPWAVPVEKCFTWETMALAALDVGDRERAEALVDRAERLSAALDLDVPAGVAARGRAALLLAGGDLAGAAEVAAASFRRLTHAGAGLQAAFAGQILGRAQLAAGDRPSGIATLRDTEHAFDRMGSVRARDEVRRELRTVGARVEPRGPATPGDSGLAALTRREVEIADLVTDRLTNREIAGRLFLSEKTVESHVRNISRKLGVSSRVAVARLVEADRRSG